MADKMNEEDLKRVYSVANALFKKAKGNDWNAAYCLDLASYVYLLITEDAHTDSYWDNAVKTLSVLERKYRDGNRLTSLWAQSVLLTADDIRTGRRKVRTED